jgi:queuine tRNA-ribosyltransferase
MWLVREARKHILAGDFRTWKEMMVKIYEPKIVKKMFEVF